MPLPRLPKHEEPFARWYCDPTGYEWSGATGNILGGRSTEHVVYSPLRESRGTPKERAYLAFRRVADAPDFDRAILEFTNVWGLLTYSVVHLRDPGPRQYRNALARDASKYLTAFALWHALQSRDRLGILDILTIHPGREAQIRFRRVGGVEHELFRLRPGIGGSIPEEEFNTWRDPSRGAPVGRPAHWCLVALINRNLDGAASYKLLANGLADAKAEDDFIAQWWLADLRSVIWFQFARLVSGLYEIRPCEECREPLDMSNHTAAKRFCDRCKNRRAMANWRARKRAKQNGETS